MLVHFRRKKSRINDEISVYKILFPLNAIKTIYSLILRYIVNNLFHCL